MLPGVSDDHAFRRNDPSTSEASVVGPSSPFITLTAAPTLGLALALTKTASFSFLQSVQRSDFSYIHSCATISAQC